MYKKWTPKEDEILISAVKDCFGNLRLAFNAASELTGRTPDACSFRWYSKLSKMKETTTFFCVSKSKGIKNRKNTTETKVIRPSKFKRIWDSIVKIMKDED